MISAERVNGVPGKRDSVLANIAVGTPDMSNYEQRWHENIGIYETVSLLLAQVPVLWGTGHYGRWGMLGSIRPAVVIWKGSLQGWNILIGIVH